MKVLQVAVSPEKPMDRVPSEERQRCHAVRAQRKRLQYSFRVEQHNKQWQMLYIPMSEDGPVVTTKSMPSIKQSILVSNDQYKQFPAQIKQSRMKLPTPLAWMIVSIELNLYKSEMTYDWRLHHGKVVAINADHCAVLLAQQFLPPVRAKVSAVLEEPLHALWVIVLWRRPWVIRVLAHTISSPDEQSRWGLEWFVLHENGFVLLKGPDAVLEMGKEPAWCLASASAEQPYFVEEMMETAGKRLQSYWARSINQD